MNCLIVGSSNEKNLNSLQKNMNFFLKNKTFEKIFAVDGGLKTILKLGLPYNYLIGDLDSLSKKYLKNVPKNKIIKLNPEKDKTDMFFTVEKAVNMGFKKIYIIGGTQNRFDHSFSNIQTIFYFKKKKIDISIIDSINFIKVISNEKLYINYLKNYYISFFSLDKYSYININGLKYNLDNYKLKNIDSLCVSNEFSKKGKAKIDVIGNILMILSKK